MLHMTKFLCFLTLWSHVQSTVQNKILIKCLHSTNVTLKPYQMLAGCWAVEQEANRSSGVGWGAPRARCARQVRGHRRGAPRARCCSRFTGEGVVAVPRPAGKQQGPSLWSCPNALFHAHSGGLHPPWCPVSSVSVGDGQHVSPTTTATQKQRKQQRCYWGSARLGRGRTESFIRITHTFLTESLQWHNRNEMQARIRCRTGKWWSAVRRSGRCWKAPICPCECDSFLGWRGNRWWY